MFPMSKNGNSFIYTPSGRCALGVPLPTAPTAASALHINEKPVGSGSLQLDLGRKWAPIPNCRDGTWELSIIKWTSGSPQKESPFDSGDLALILDQGALPGDLLGNRCFRVFVGRLPIVDRLKSMLPSDEIQRGGQQIGLFRP